MGAVNTSEGAFYLLEAGEPENRQVCLPMALLHRPGFGGRRWNRQRYRVFRPLSTCRRSDGRTHEQRLQPAKAGRAGHLIVEHWAPSQS